MNVNTSKSQNIPIQGVKTHKAHLVLLQHFYKSVTSLDVICTYEIPTQCTVNVAGFVTSNVLHKLFTNNFHPPANLSCGQSEEPGLGGDEVGGCLNCKILPGVISYLQLSSPNLHFCKQHVLRLEFWHPVFTSPFLNVIISKLYFFIIAIVFYFTYANIKKFQNQKDFFLIFTQNKHLSLSLF